METKFRRKSRVITLEQMCKKMTANNPNVDLVSINSYVKFGQNLSFWSQDQVNQGP